MAVLAIENPTYKPAMRIISAATNGNPAAITTTFAHNYLTGTIVRLMFPLGYGMQSANEKQGIVTVTGDTTFTIDIDTTDIDPFVVPTTFPENKQSAQVVPVGAVSDLLKAAVQNVLPY